MCQLYPVSLFDPSNRCFVNSTSNALSKNEVITLVVLGALSLIVAGGALYGYLLDPSWMVEAHLLNGITCACWVVIGALLIVKTISVHTSSSRE